MIGRDSLHLAKLTIFVVTFIAGVRTLDVKCNSDLFCHGDLLHRIQMAHLANDSKTFVDMHAKSDPGYIISQFNELMAKTNDNPSKEQLRDFVREHFSERGGEFEPWDPSDWQPNPAFLSKIADLELRTWAKELHSYWKQLGRKISVDVSKSPDRYSQIYVSNPFIVPGGRFQEFYYWDSYWIMQGLLVSNMTHTVKGMLQNFLSLVRDIGHIPNGNRVYYLERSQPPFLIPMVNLYLDATNDTAFIRDNIDLLIREFDFWEAHRVRPIRVSNDEYNLHLYAVETANPRPESYREDYHLASGLSTEEEKKELYKNIHSAAESGWDFSSRWFIKDGGNEGSLMDLKTRDIIPVELNALMALNARLLVKFLGLVDTDQAKLDKKKFENLVKVKERNMDFLWNEAQGVWQDYDAVNKKHRDYFYMSNMIPLFTDTFGSKSNKEEVVKKVIRYLEDQSVLDYVGGVPTSSTPTKQQWDFPQGWAPLQHMLIMGLYVQPNPEAKDLALKLAQKWIDANYQTYMETGAMFEKYDVTKLAAGHGGEYDVQLGFGWTNGVVLHFLQVFGDKLTVPNDSSSTVKVMPSLLVVLLVLRSVIQVTI